MKQPTLKCSLFLLLIGFYTQGVKAQNTLAQPQNGIEQLSALFKEIPFTTEQQDELIDKTVELVFLVDETGEATLEEIKGIENKAILDSFYQQQSKLPKFIPQIQNGNPIVSYFILELEFKSTKYDKDSKDNRIPVFRSCKKEDFEYIETGEGRFESLISGIGTGHFGDPANQYQLGGGYKIDFVYVTKPGIGGGLTMSTFSNQLTSDITEFNLVFDRSLVSSIGLVFIHSLKWQPSPKTKIAWQIELNSIVQEFSQNDLVGNITAVQFSNFSPALGINYSIQLGKERYRSSLFYINAIESTNYLNIHVAIRPKVTDFVNTGAFFEFGLGLRNQSRIVKDYKWKN